MAAEKKTATPTEYYVFKNVAVEGPPSWQRVRALRAASASAAIRACVAKEAEQAGVFVAVPARSWKPVTVQPQTTIRLELTEAKP